jgi:hypothetical protein
LRSHKTPVSKQQTRNPTPSPFCHHNITHYP